MGEEREGMGNWGSNAADMFSPESEMLRDGQTLDCFAVCPGHSTSVRVP
ncbi:MAG: hypothetical protein RL514_1181 [Verrucomicrobiota bacterium]|jgi:hypothetical protein